MGGAVQNSRVYIVEYAHFARCAAVSIIANSRLNGRMPVITWAMEPGPGGGGGGGAMPSHNFAS